MTLNITEPTVGASSGSWGQTLNDALTAIVAYVNNVESNAQPVDADLTAIAALTTTAYGRSLLTQANAAAAQTLLGLGTAATQASSAFDAAGAATTAQAAAIAAAATDATTKANAAAAASQPVDSDLTAIAALSTTAFGRSFLDRADATAARTLLGLGSLATQSGTFSGTSSGTNTGDQTIPVTSVFGRTGAVALTKADVTGTGLAAADIGAAPAGNYVAQTTTVNGHALTGNVTVTATDAGADISGAAAAVQAASLQKASNLSDVANAGTARTNLGLGTAAVVNTGTASGNAPLLGTGGVLPIAQLATGTPTGAKFVRDDGVLAVPAGGGGSSLLACMTYAPASNTAYSISAQTTPVAVDTTNLQTGSFTAPASGRVLVRLSALGRQTTTTNVYWGLVDHGTTTLRGSLGQVTWNQTNVTFSSMPILVTGLTAGNTYNFDWAWCSSSSAAIWVQSSTSTSGAGTPNAPATMEVWTA